VTGYIHYNKDDDLTKIFDVLKDFRTRLGLKFSHHKDYIFFSLKSEHLNELAQKQPFRISHYRSKSEYKCDKATSEKLTKQSDSFLRMTWNEETGMVQFLSRTTGRVHMYLVLRIFNDSTTKFEKQNYSVVKLQNQSDGQDDQQTEQTQQTQQAQQAQQTKQTQQTQQAQQTTNFRGPRNFTQNASSVDGFTVVTRGSRGATANSNGARNNTRFSREYSGSRVQAQSQDSAQSTPRVVPSGRTFAGRAGSGSSKIEVEQSEPKPRTSRTTYKDMVSAKN
jgi:hypothetical protein